MPLRMTELSFVLALCPVLTILCWIPTSAAGSPKKGSLGRDTGYLPTAAACSSSVHPVEHTSCVIHDGCLASPAVGEEAAEPTGTTTMGHLFPTQGMKCPRPPTSDSPMIHNEATRAWYGVTANL